MSAAHPLDTPRLRDLRQAGAEAFATLGVPSSKEESWRYTRLQPLAGLPFPAAPRPEELHIAHLAVPTTGARVFLIDGHFFGEVARELPLGVTVLSLAQALADGQSATRDLLGDLATPQRSLTALNSAMLDDGVLIDVGANVVLDRPVHIVHVSSAHPATTATYPRVLVRLGSGARATVLESFVGPATNVVANAVTEIELGAGTNLEHLRLPRAGDVRVAATYVNVQRDARYVLHDVTVGSPLAREEIDVRLTGAGASASLGGLLLGRADDVVDHQVQIDHAAPSTESDQLYRTILDGHATGNFAGKVVVHSSAAQTNAKQSSRALLLSATSKANAKPQLEIYTDDVRCTHGATSGQLDDDALFYLQARGIDRDEAQRMLTLAFAGEWLDRIGDPDLRATVTESVHTWLEQSDPRSRS